MQLRDGKPTVKDVIDSFYLDQQVGERSEQTHNFYKQHFDQWIKFKPAIADKHMDALTVDDVQSFLLSKNQYPYAKHGAYRSIRALCYFAFRREITPKNIITQIRTPKLPQREKPIITIEQFRRLIHTCGNSFLGLRDKAIMMVLYDCGLRRSELLQMTFENIDLKTKRIQIIGKGNKQRTVGFSEKTLDALLEYFKAHPKKVNTDSVWLTEEKHKLREDGLREILYKRGKMAGIGTVNPHRFRHSCATNLLQSGMGIDSVRRFLGQESLSVLLNYLKTLNSQDASNEHEKYSPMRNL